MGVAELGVVSILLLAHPIKNMHCGYMAHGQMKLMMFRFKLFIFDLFFLILTWGSSS